MRKLILLVLVMAIPGANAFGSGPKEEAEVWAASAQNILGSVELQAPDRTLSDLLEAFHAASEEFGYHSTRTRLKETEAVLTYRGREDAKIIVKLKEFRGFTNIKVRCGLTGNDALSRKLLERVYARL